MRVLILDDLQERHDGFKTILSAHDLTHVWSFDGWQDRFKVLMMSLESGNPEPGYGLVCLDHDLEDYVHDMYGKVERTGETCVLWMLHNVPKVLWPEKALVHSWNPEGADRMAHHLRQAGIDVMVKPFKAPT